MPGEVIVQEVRWKVGSTITRRLGNRDGHDRARTTAQAAIAPAARSNLECQRRLIAGLTFTLTGARPGTFDMETAVVSNLHDLLGRQAISRFREPEGKRSVAAFGLNL